MTNPRDDYTPHFTADSKGKGSSADAMQISQYDDDGGIGDSGTFSLDLNGSGRFLADSAGSGALLERMFSNDGGASSMRTDAFAGSFLDGSFNCNRSSAVLTDSLQSCQQPTNNDSSSMHVESVRDSRSSLSRYHSGERNNTGHRNRCRNNSGTKPALIMSEVDFDPTTLKQKRGNDISTFDDFLNSSSSRHTSGSTHQINYSQPPAKKALKKRATLDQALDLLALSQGSEGGGTSVGNRGAVPMIPHQLHQQQALPESYYPRQQQHQREQSPSPPDTTNAENNNMVVENNNPIQYHEALQNLAESMKRTELSRRQLIMQRIEQQQRHCQQQQQQQQVQHGHTPREQQAFQQMVMAGGDTNPSIIEQPTSMAFVSTRQPHNLSSQQRSRPTQRQPSNIDEGDVDRVAAFLSGSRRTLTNGLEHSRMQLRMYADHTGK